jgi:hypothetical protein
MQKEIWKDVVNYEGLYQVSNLGRVKSIERNGTGKGGRILSPSDNGLGYLKVTLKNKSNKYCYVHRLVYESFTGKQSVKGITAIDHINNDKSDNRLCNLQLISQRENKIKSTKNQLNEPNIYLVNSKYRLILHGKHIGYFNNLLDAITIRNNIIK